MKALARIRLIVFVMLAAFTAGQAQAAPLSVSDKPLFSVVTIPPNVLVALDDSGSMTWDMVFSGPNQGTLYWQGGGNDSFVNNDGSYRPGGAQFPLLWPKTQPGGGTRVVPPFIQYAFARSPDYNGMYYNPDVDYTPWPDVGGFTFTDAPVNDAPFHVIDDGGGAPVTPPGAGLDFTSDLQDNAGNHRFGLRDDMIIPAGTTWVNGGWTVAAVDTQFWTNANRGVRWDPSVYYRVTDVGQYNVTGGVPNLDCAAPHNPAHYKTFEDNPSDFSGTGNIVALGPDGRCLERFDAQGAVAPSSRPDDLQNLANYFTYYRKRHLATRNGLAAALNEVPIAMNVGYLTINTRALIGMNRFDPNPIFDNRDPLFTALMDENYGGGTPNRRALLAAGNFMEGGLVQFACQKNFAMLFTDGFTNSGRPNVGGNLDSAAQNFPDFPAIPLSGAAPYGDTFANTIADTAMRFYRDFNGGAFTPGLVPVPPACGSTAGAAPLDCNRDLHMNTYVVTLNGRGTIFDNTFGGNFYDEIQDAYDFPPAWPDDTDNFPGSVDALYHAAVNGRGLMLNATSPAELRQRFQEAFQDIVSKTRASTALTAAATRISTGSNVYQAGFNPDGWSGEVTGFELDGSGNLVEQWRASQTIAGAVGSRNLITWNGAAQVPFTWADLTPAQQTEFIATAEAAMGRPALEAAFGVTDAAIGTRLMQYLSGQDGDELRNGGILRDRFDIDKGEVNPLGTIVGSVPQLMGPRNEGWARLPAGDGGGAIYRNFIDTVKPGRTPEVTVFVAANDGALHAFDADNGNELFAYFPGMVAGRLSELADPDYDHKFFADGTPIIADAYHGGWKSVLVGSLGAGGRGYFALDVTDPASPQVLWEFSGADDPDLGTAIGRAAITRADDGTWVAAFGNGFGSQDNDGYFFVLDLFSGAVLKKLQVSNDGSLASPAGMASPRMLMNATDGLSVEAFYLGDLKGRMFKIDASGAPGSWNVALGGDPLFTAADGGGNVQPITAAPTLARTPLGEVGVYFGTGKYFELNDNAVDPADPIDSFYAVFDTGVPNYDRSVLTEVDLNPTQTSEGREVRTLSASSTLDPEGFFIDLFVAGEGKGERVITTPTVRFGVLLFTSFQPSSDDCVPGGLPRLYSLDARSGAPRLLQVATVGTPPGTPTLPDVGAIQLGAGASLEVPVLIDESYDPATADPWLVAEVNRIGRGRLCRPVVAIDPVTQTRVVIGALCEGRVNWDQRQPTID